LTTCRRVSPQDADSSEQVVDSIQFFPAQFVIDLSSRRLGAGCRGMGGHFCTKLSTTSVI
jgi:hypothetical protein